MHQHFDLPNGSSRKNTFPRRNARFIRSCHAPPHLRSSIFRRVSPRHHPYFFGGASLLHSVCNHHLFRFQLRRRSCRVIVSTLHTRTRTASSRVDVRGVVGATRKPCMVRFSIPRIPRTRLARLFVSASSLFVFLFPFVSSSYLFRSCSFQS